MSNKMESNLRRERGVALIVVLMLLVITTIVALNAVRFGTMQLRIAANDEFRLGAYQTAQSIVDATISDSTYTPVNDVAGAVACTSTSLTGCGSVPTVISTLPSSYLASEMANGEVNIRVNRINPLCSQAPPSLGISLKNWAAASFEVDAAYQPSASGDRGNSEVHQGVIVLFKLADSAGGSC